MRDFLVLGGTKMRDFLVFRWMITPLLIQLVFWIGVVGAFLGGIGLIAAAGGEGILSGEIRMTGVLLIVFGPVVWRIYCELMILYFRMNETLTEIKHLLERGPP